MTSVKGAMPYAPPITTALALPFNTKRFFAKSPAFDRHYPLQSAQLMAEHVLQEAPPPIGADAPPVPLEKEAKGENIRLASL